MCIYIYRICIHIPTCIQYRSHRSRDMKTTSIYTAAGSRRAAAGDRCPAAWPEKWSKQVAQQVAPYKVEQTSGTIQARHRLPCCLANMLPCCNTDKCCPLSFPQAICVCPPSKGAAGSLFKNPLQKLLFLTPYEDSEVAGSLPAETQRWHKGSLSAKAYSLTQRWHNGSLSASGWHGGSIPFGRE